MSRYTSAKCKLCRREGTKLFLKGNRCQTGKCSVSKREHPPGAHPWRRVRPTEYARRLREKQKLKRIYGIFEKSFRRTFRQADRQRGNTGENLLVLLERRLDSVVLNAGMAHSRANARQMIVHGHFRVNGRRVTAPGQPPHRRRRSAGGESILDANGWRDPERDPVAHGAHVAR